MPTCAVGCRIYGFCFRFFGLGFARLDIGFIVFVLGSVVSPRFTVGGLHKHPTHLPSRAQGSEFGDEYSVFVIQDLGFHLHCHKLPQSPAPPLIDLRFGFGVHGSGFGVILQGIRISEFPSVVMPTCRISATSLKCRQVSRFHSSERGVCVCVCVCVCACACACACACEILALFSLVFLTVMLLQPAHLQ